ncbi:hypothetical protein [Floridanema evergladense]|uniref:Transposase n=1 Tax=Floridaenema evergladense BLCC-F167 TaxID=3153639 RepID=A0ABV4WD24_9CYAN
MNKSQEFFLKFLELGSVSAVAKFYGTSRNNVHQYLIKMPEYQQYRRPVPTPAPACPNCESDRTVNDGKDKKRKQYRCRDCGFKWRDPRKG